jgi:D-beta-D-heptose 7-phosphate kinase / D-beta-D-heptose 1-phosphate adenosyltransferase
VKGADYTLETVVGADIVTRRGGKVVLAQLLPAHSTSDTLRRIAASGKA